MGFGGGHHRCLGMHFAYLPDQGALDGVVAFRSGIVLPTTRAGLRELGHRPAPAVWGCAPGGIPCGWGLVTASVARHYDVAVVGAGPVARSRPWPMRGGAPGWRCVRPIRVRPGAWPASGSTRRRSRCCASSASISRARSPSTPAARGFVVFPDDDRALPPALRRWGPRIQLPAPGAGGTAAPCCRLAPRGRVPGPACGCAASRAVPCITPRTAAAVF